MFTNIANEYTAILGELYRLNGKGAPPVFTTKGKALTDILYEANRLDTGAYGTYPAYTSEGDLLDRISIALVGTSGGGETPVITNLDASTLAVTGTATGTIQIRKYTNRVEVDAVISGPAAWTVSIPYTADFVAPLGNGVGNWEHALGDGARMFDNGSNFRIQPNATFAFDKCFCYSFTGN